MRIYDSTTLEFCCLQALIGTSLKSRSKIIDVLDDCSLAGADVLSYGHRATDK